MEHVVSSCSLLVSRIAALGNIDLNAGLIGLI